MKLPRGLYHVLKSWRRLETRSRSVEHISVGLQAKTADPLWYLSRQWVLGEFQAEDAGSITKVDLEYNTQRVESYGPNLTNYQSLSDLPLEVLVEREPVPWDWRMRIRAGQQLERFAIEKSGAALIETLRNLYKVVVPPRDQVDEASWRYIKLMEGRAMDGKRFYDSMNQITDPAIILIRTEFEKWYNALFSQPSPGTSPCWQSKTLEYKFGVKTDKQTELVSEHYRNGDLEWYTSNLKTSAAAPLIPLAQVGKPPPPLLPTRVKFAGMAHPRWWTMEDSVIDFGKMDVNKSELIKTMLMNFMLIHGDDWFCVPLSLPTGSLTEVTKVKTTDVFGVKLYILNGSINDPEPLKRWDLFSLSKHDDPTRNSDRDYLYLPPSSGFREESEAIEVVLFLRDENANLVFGIERKASNAWGTIVPVREQYIESQRRAEENAREATAEGEEEPAGHPSLEYKLATPVAENWFPYVPARVSGSNDQIFLSQARLPNVDTDITGPDGLSRIPAPVTRVLKESTVLNEESVTRAGVLVKLNRQRLRWIDGKTYVWIGRSVVTGRGEGSSGLKFDVIKNISN